ncbi:hypothetical protein BGW80DRAFT_1319435 [Lactifluus volemus]|nr:hypothetical protein BGW80DRAFT_1319435 [Lactifluus volemus]
MGEGSLSDYDLGTRWVSAFFPSHISTGSPPAPACFPMHSSTTPVSGTIISQSCLSPGSRPLYANKTSGPSIGSCAPGPAMR